MPPNRVLVDLRHRLWLSQAEFAERMGWTQGFVSQLETGERSIARHALSLAEAFSGELAGLGFTVEDLLRGERRARDLGPGSLRG